MPDYRRSAPEARDWALDLLRRVSRRQDGINHPLPGEQAAVEQIIRSIPADECEGRGGLWGMLTTSPEDCAEQARQWLANLSARLGASPTLYGYAETVAAAQDATLSSVEWRRAQTLREQLRGAAAQTAADVQEAADVALPQVGFGLGAVGGLAALVLAWRVLR